MKKISLLFGAMTIFVLGANAQFKKDGTPDMRYKANKEVYGSGYNTSSYSMPSYSEPVYSQPRQERNYNNGGQYKIQNGYLKSKGTYVEPHIKTTPDNYKWNNVNNWEY
jgi:hypothetical protein